MPPSLPLDPDTLADFCRRNGISKLSLFGSQLKGTARPDSDIDLLVEFEPDRIPGLIEMAGMELDLTDLMNGRKVDLRTPGDSSRYFRDEVVREAAANVSADIRDVHPEIRGAASSACETGSFVPMPISIWRSSGGPRATNCRSCSGLSAGSI